jgi:hypothetical protein
LTSQALSPSSALMVLRAYAASAAPPKPIPAASSPSKPSEKTGFELHDLYIEVENASYTADGPSCSTYGLYLSGCSNYQIVRCRIHAGDATDGKPGDPVSNGRDGAPGQKGQDGCRQCQPGVEPDNNQGGVGGSSWSGGAQAGGNGGNGGPIGTGRGPAGCFDLNFCNGASAPPGQPGQNGNTAVGGQIVGIGGAAGSGQNICSNFTDAAEFIGALGGCPSDGGLIRGKMACLVHPVGMALTVHRVRLPLQADGLSLAMDRMASPASPGVGAAVEAVEAP